jgi:hypothetical protein
MQISPPVEGYNTQNARTGGVLREQAEQVNAVEPRPAVDPDRRAGAEPGQPAYTGRERRRDQRREGERRAGGVAVLLDTRAQRERRQRERRRDVRQESAPSVLEHTSPRGVDLYV